MSDTAARHIKWTFSDDCLGAVRFPSGGTGAMIDGDPGFGWGDWDFTSDRVGNKVDRNSGCFEDSKPRRAYIVIAYVPAPRGDAVMIGEQLAGGLGSIYIPSPADCPRRPAALVEAFEPSDETPAVPAPMRSLAEELADLRRSLDMPVSDLARMIGLGRRQFYNLLSGAPTVPTTESRIRRVAETIRELNRVLGGNADLVRSAVLTPVGDKSLSVFDAASLGDEASIRESLDALRLRVTGRGIRRTRRAIPRAASPEQREQRLRRTREEIGRLSAPGSDPIVQGEPGGPD